MKRLAKLGLVKGAPGMAALDMNTAEDSVVAHTREVIPGFVLCGMVGSLCLPVCLDSIDPISMCHSSLKFDTPSIQM